MHDPFRLLRDPRTGLILARILHMSAELDALTANVTRITTVADSAIALLQNIKARLDAAGTDPAALTALSTSLGTESDKLAQAITDNTPAA